MPFVSKRQRAYLFANKPELAKKWAGKYGGRIGGGKLSKKQRRRAVELARLRRKKKKK